jgi:hypothetical protein
MYVTVFKATLIYGFRALIGEVDGYFGCKKPVLEKSCDTVPFSCAIVTLKIRFPALFARFLVVHTS